MNPCRCLLSSFAVVALATLGACSSPQPDEAPDSGPPDPLGNGERIKQVMDPASPKHPASGATVTITGASFVTVDTYDEQGTGKGVGTVYLQDTGSSAAFSGASLYEPTYLPASLHPAPGDVLDLVGKYTADTSIGTFDFTPGEALIQISTPSVTFRFEYLVPTPAVIDVTDLNDYTKGNQWLSMLVTVKNVTLTGGLSDVGGRATAYITPVISGTSAEMSNELFDVVSWNATQTKKLTSGAKLTSLTGLVTWFSQYHIAPRSPADIVLE